MRPILLDLYCGVGGASMGYHRAGFDVVGVDVKPQPRYPFPFIQGDALEYLRMLGRAVHAIHASPPCQPWSTGTSEATKAATPKLIAATRELLEETGRPWVIENVVGARAELRANLALCGYSFGLPISRHRLFESPLMLMGLEHQDHRAQPRPDIGEVFDRPAVGSRAYSVTGKARYAGQLEHWREWMGMPWARTERELSEAIPPAYTEHIGRQLMEAVLAGA